MKQSQAQELLELAFGSGSQFREGQLQAIESVLVPGSRLLVVQRTGWGKSIVYFIATSINRSKGKGLTLILSPLLALMRNQIAMASRFGLSAATINSSNEEEWEGIHGRLTEGTVDVLFVSPERLANEKFRALLSAILGQVGLLVIDEAHCISDWGHDFRPDYRRIIQLTSDLPSHASVLATTATATTAVVEDVVKQLGGNVQVQRGTILRKSLCLSAHELNTYAERLAWLRKCLPRFEGSGIVYTLTVHDASQVADYLSSVGFASKAYHSEIPHEERLRIEDDFANNRLKAVVATSALGMGYDKADVGFVVHYQLPPSVLAYYQQIGRAGRMLKTAFACLLFSSADQEIAEHFARVSLPGKELFDHLVGQATEELQAASSLAQGLRVSRSKVFQALSILEVDGVLERKSGQYRRGSEEKTFDFDHYSALQKKRIADSDAMLEFARASQCRMQIVGRALGDPEVAPCGRCDVCKPHSPVDLSLAAVREAEIFLRAERFTIWPRLMMPATGHARGSKIAAHLILEKGLCLSYYNDSGYGGLVRQAKYRNHEFGEELLQASAEAIIAEKIQVDWVAGVPSHSSDQVPRFARRLATRLELPYVECISKIEDNLPQKSMTHSQLQFENVSGAFRVDGPNPGRCLLVDDIVDSGWTLTVIGQLLRKAGSGPVVPFALATSRPRRPQ